MSTFFRALLRGASSSSYRYDVRARATCGVAGRYRALADILVISRAQHVTTHPGSSVRGRRGRGVTHRQLSLLLLLVQELLLMQLRHHLVLPKGARPWSTRSGGRGSSSSDSSLVRPVRGVHHRARTLSVRALSLSSSRVTYPRPLLLPLSPSGDQWSVKASASRARVGARELQATFCDKRGRAGALRSVAFCFFF